MLVAKFDGAYDRDHITEIKIVLFVHGFDASTPFANPAVIFAAAGEAGNP
jgi:hypothetical protein